MAIKSPWKELVECCFYEGVYKLVSGEIPLDGIQDFIDHYIEELMDTDEFKQMVDEYFDSFIDIKNLSGDGMCLVEEGKNVD